MTNDEEEVPFDAESLMEDMSMVQFATFDDDVTTSASLDDDWEQEIFTRARGDEILIDNDENDDHEDVPSPPVTETLSSLKARQYITELKTFALAGDNEELLTLMQKAEDLIEDRFMSEAKRKKTQTTLDDYFNA